MHSLATSLNLRQRTTVLNVLSVVVVTVVVVRVAVACAYRIELRCVWKCRLAGRQLRQKNYKRVGQDTTTRCSGLASKCQVVVVVTAVVVVVVVIVVLTKTQS